MARKKSRHGVPSYFRDANGKKLHNPEYELMVRRSNGMLPRGVKRKGQSRYGVLVYLPPDANGKIRQNPEYTRRYNRAHGIQPRKTVGDNTYGVPNQINGKRNPAYFQAYKRAHGIAPLQPSKYGVTACIRDANGKRRRNPEYTLRWNRAHGIPPRSKVRHDNHRFPSRLANGKLNPEYYKTQKRARASRAAKQRSDLHLSMAYG
jgi:hypothetical protein